jgi:bifunctional ADP-heptose synthase (sugar kinase/adenylyltransferase)
MPFFHIVAKVGKDEEFRSLFKDLSADELKTRFIKSFEKGTSFFSGNDLIAPSDLRTIQIIRTEREDKVERDEMNRKDLESIRQSNNSSAGVVFISPGRGYEPQHIAEVGADVTHTYVKGPPGFKSYWWESRKKEITLGVGIVAALGTVAKLLGFF